MSFSSVYSSFISIYLNRKKVILTIDLDKSEPNIEIIVVSYDVMHNKKNEGIKWRELSLKSVLNLS